MNTVWEPWWESRKTHVKFTVFIFSWRGICTTLMENIRSQSMQIWDLFQTLHVCVRLFWDIQKCGLKTEIRSERYENKSTWKKKKAQIMLKKGDLCGILSQTCPLYSQMEDSNKTQWSGDFKTCLSHFYLQWDSPVTHSSNLKYYQTRFGPKK